jgi:hypothetical protein
MQTTESASTPISAGGYRYNPTTRRTSPTTPSSPRPSFAIWRPNMASTSPPTQP